MATRTGKINNDAGLNTYCKTMALDIANGFEDQDARYTEIHERVAESKHINETSNIFLILSRCDYQNGEKAFHKTGPHNHETFAEMAETIAYEEICFRVKSALFDIEQSEIAEQREKG